MNSEPLRIFYVNIGESIPKPTVPATIKMPLVSACEMANISVIDAKSAKRDLDLCKRRYHVMHILRSWGRSTPQIGRMLGGRDHTTILHGLKRYDQLLKNPNARAKELML